MERWRRRELGCERGGRAPKLRRVRERGSPSAFASRTFGGGGGISLSSGACGGRVRPSECWAIVIRGRSNNQLNRTRVFGSPSPRALHQNALVLGGIWVAFAESGSFIMGSLGRNLTPLDARVGLVPMENHRGNPAQRKFLGLGFCLLLAADGTEEK